MTKEQSIALVPIDAEALKEFTNRMAAKLHKSVVEKGRSGWEDLKQDALSRMLREHVEKGDPVDVANFCMMLSYHGFSILPDGAVEQTKPAVSGVHTLYVTGDSDAPEQIKDRNGEVVLAQCRVCGAAEIELDLKECDPAWKGGRGFCVGTQNP